MKRTKLYVFLIVVFVLNTKGIGLTETMYVSDRLYLSFRSVPDPEQPALDLLSSDTKVDVLENQGKWARVRLEDGRTGWVWKRYLVKDVPKSLIIEQLNRQIENQKITTKRLVEEIAARDKEIAALKNQIGQQNERFEMAVKESASNRLKGLYITGIVTLAVGFVIGYLARRHQKPILGFLPTDQIRKRLLGS
ncbi:MAG: TIGR04211 family SH3 domain-containing protein [Proteobacteria bacterium]|nr:TIGR04211 family SH3 domain-containing protein [Pseudomonadota bacterium]